MNKMAKKALIIIIIAVVFGVVGAAGGIYFMINRFNPENQEVVEEEIEVDLKNCASLTLEKMTIPLKRVSSKASYMKASFIITFADEEMLATGEKLKEHYRDAILGVFESKTVAELDGKRIEMKEPVLEAIRALYNNEEDREKIIAVDIPDYELPDIPAYSLTATSEN